MQVLLRIELNDDRFDRLAATHLAHHRNGSGIRRSRFALSPKHAPPRSPGSFLHVDQMTAETVRSHQEQNSFVGTAFLGSGNNRGEWKPDHETGADVTPTGSTLLQTSGREAPYK